MAGSLDPGTDQALKKLQGAFSDIMNLDNSTSVSDLSFPESVPVLCILASDSVDSTPEWI